MSDASLTKRLVIGKGIGFVVGGLGFFIMPMLWADVPTSLQWGIWAWYITFGAFIALVGIYTEHPILKIPMPWWLRSAAVGSWLNFVLYLFIADKVAMLMESGIGAGMSPAWMILEGTVVGLIIGFFATKFAGEGKELVDNM